MDSISINPLLIKRLALLLLLIYGCQVAQISRIETYFKGKEWATIQSIKHVETVNPSFIEAANNRKKSPLMLERTIVQKYSFMRPASHLNHRFGSLARKYRALNC
jgi:hypothetical protein